MRFMMLVIPKGYEKAAPGTAPDVKLVEEMTKYIQELSDVPPEVQQAAGGR